MTALEFQGVWKRYERGPTEWDALAGLNLRIDRGETVAVVGASGSGKTTLMNLAAGLDRPTRGRVLLMGEPLEALGPAAMARRRRAHVGFVFQVLNLLPALTVEENIELPMALNGWGRPRRRDRARTLLEAADLANFQARFPHELSLGQQQRVAVLRALAHQPAIVLMDEPTSALDSSHSGRLMDLVLDLAAREQVTVLVATHDERVAERFRRRVRLLDGRVVGDEGAPRA
jgi:ABC-type lipoprotein export system ATPase subunit